MITIEQARESLEFLYDYGEDKAKLSDYHILNEFINQYADLVKVKKLGVLLDPKEGTSKGE